MYFAFRGEHAGRRIDDEPGKVLSKQRGAWAEFVGGGGRGRGAEVCLQLDVRDVWPARQGADDGGFTAAANQSLRRIEVDVREDAAVVSAGSRAGVRGVPLFQCGGGEQAIRGTSPDRNAFDPERTQSAAGAVVALRDFWDRLSDSGWDVYTGLHSCD